MNYIQIKNYNLTKVIAIAITFFIFILSISTVSFFSDRPLIIKSNSDSCGAIAIRDNVNVFQKFGTRLFTLPYLNKYYDEVAYFTQDSYVDKHKEFVESLDKLLSKYKKVDIFLLAHSNFYYEWINEIDTEKRKNIRLVYNTGCCNYQQSKIWLELGAKAYVAHKGVKSISPAFYFFFLRRWGSGDDLLKAVNESNEMMNKKLNRFGISNLDIQESIGIICGDSLISINK